MNQAKIAALRGQANGSPSDGHGLILIDRTDLHHLLDHVEELKAILGQVATIAHARPYRTIANVWKEVAAEVGSHGEKA